MKKIYYLFAISIILSAFPRQIYGQITRLGDFSGTQGADGTYIGSYAGFDSETGQRNVLIGHCAGMENFYGHFNTALGAHAGFFFYEGSGNTLVGFEAGYSLWGGNNNVIMGRGAGFNNGQGNQNIFIGYNAGRQGYSGSNNVFIGNHSGYFESSSNRLYIANSSTSTPLIYGEFDNNRLTVHGDLGIGTKTPQQKLDVRGNIISNTSNPFIWFKHNNENVGVLGSDGSIYGGTATNLGLYVYGNNALELSTNNFKRLVIDGSGRVGIGTPTPQRRFEVSGADAENESFSIRNTSYSSTDDSGAVSIRMGFGNHVTKVISLDKFAVNVSKLNLYGEYGYNSHALGLSLTPVAADLCNAYFTGKVGIGTDSPGYKLDVCGTIRAREVKIDLDGTCVPDFVFRDDYPLMDIKELEQFVRQNHHLPDIPSEKEFLENGINMKELQMKLLQKIEELTLYTIHQEERIKALEASLNKHSSVAKLP